MSIFDTCTLLRGGKNKVNDLVNFSDVQWNYLLSQNTGSSNNIVTFTRPASADWVDWNSAFLMLPVTILTTNTNNTNTNVKANPFCIGFKPAGALSLIDHVLLQLNGIQVGVQSPLQCVWQHLRNIFTFSYDWLQVAGPNFFLGKTLPEYEVNSYVNTTVITSNSVVTPAVDTIVWSSLLGPRGYNKCLYERIMSGGYPSRYSASAAAAIDLPLTAAGQTRHSYFVSAAGSAAADAASVYYQLYCPIPLPWVSDVFRSLGMARHISLNLQVYVNNVTGIAPTALAVGSTTTGSFKQNYCPIMLTTVGMATADVAGNGGIKTASLTVGTTPASSSATTNVQSELWFATIRPTAQQEAELLASSSRVLEWDDYYFQSSVPFASSGVGASSSFSHNVWPSVSSPKKLYILGFMDASVDTGGTQPEIRQVSCAPHYSDAGFSLANISVKIDNQPISQQPEIYDYQDFVKNVLPNNGLNAGQEVGVMAGLCDRMFWDTSKVYVFDLTRNCPSGSTVALSVQATNQSQWATKLLYFCETRWKSALSMSPQTSALNAPVPT